MPLLKTSAVVVCLLILVACRQETSDSPTGVVEANQAYRASFGEPPKVQAGKAYARVGYLPFKGRPTTVGAIPLFIYEKQNQLGRILGRLTSDELILAPESSLFKPFPRDTEIAIVSHVDTTLTLSLDFTSDVSFDLEPMIVALVETVLQYEDISRVTILVNGEPVAGMPAGGWTHDGHRIGDIGPPTLVMVAGIWDEGAPGPKEIMVNFDRPMTVKSFRLSHADGRKVAGDYFTSVFQMSVVVHPQEPGLFQEGSPLQVVWSVVDALGRTGSGERSVSLQRFVHEEHLGEFQKK